MQRDSQEYLELYRAILSLGSVEECSIFLDDLFTIAELKAAAQRMKVARLLYTGSTCNAAAKETGASTAHGQPRQQMLELWAGRVPAGAGTNAGRSGRCGGIPMESGIFERCTKKAPSHWVGGPVLVLAGAGSGKTSVLTNRVAYLMQEKQVEPYHILAITFTNKAANEMKERIQALVEEDVRRMAIGTFHSICARFLRHDAELLGYKPNFTIYDTDDSTVLVKKIMQEHSLSLGQMTPKAVRNLLSTIKNSAADDAPEEVIKDISEDLSEGLVEMYRLYNEALLRENAMDFDDLLGNMLRLRKQNREAREYYADRFRYVLVDEYQDTNRVQYELVKLFSSKWGNLFVVGDDDQSIYAWRGADVRNILDFEKDFKNAQVIKLEQNYRSHQRILDAANAVIRLADARKEKNPWSARVDGRKAQGVSGAQRIC